MQSSMRMLLVVIGSLVFTGPLAWAGNWTCAAQCNVTAIPDKAPASFPERVYGAGSGSSEAQACDDAKRDATQKSPKGTYPRHCKCDCSKR